ncbi:adaptor protein MecA [Sporosarcina sp. CAU 1771]
MEIERINENTVKFFLSYKDIEERGFTREEVWYNRDKSEELFWEMMDEINEEAEFEVDGPLWIQVHAMNSGIEVTVTRAQTNGDDQVSESPFEDSDMNNSFLPGADVFEEDGEIMPTGSKNLLEWTENTFVFKEFDDIILLSNRMKQFEVETSLYSFEGVYYLHALYNMEEMDDQQKTDFYSVITEFGTPSNMTIHRLKEYGDLIMSSDVFNQINKYFS